MHPNSCVIQIFSLIIQRNLLNNEQHLFYDGEITFNDLYFVCYMIERVARSIKQRNRYVVEQIGSDGLARQLSIAETNHCLNPEQVVSNWKEEYHLAEGNKM